MSGALFRLFVDDSQTDRETLDRVERITVEQQIDMIWEALVELRRPELMRSWAEEAELPQFEIMGKGAVSAEDQRVGQGEWIVFEKSGNQ